MTVAEAKSLGQLLRRPPRYGINAAAVPLALGVPTYIRITDIDDSGRFAPDPKVGVSHSRSFDYRMGVGELVFARTGASVGKSYLYDPRDGELVYAGFLINIAPDPKLLNPKYLYLFAHSKAYWDWIARSSVRSGQPGVNGREYAQLPVPLPDIAVQNAIAEAMTDADDLIAALERMIAKKQAIKQGMMQQLLTGKTRLPGFIGEWQDVAVGDLADQYRRTVDPRQDRRRRFQHFSLPAFDEGKQPLDELGASIDSIKFVVPPDAVLVSKLNPRIPRIWAPNVVGQSAIASTEFIVMTLRQGTDRSFLKWLMRSTAVASRMKLLATGTTGSHARIHPRQVAAMEVRVPTGTEQAAIAVALDDAEREISLLRQRLAKARDIRQGMIQELLSGCARLPVEKSVA